MTYHEALTYLDSLTNHEKKTDFDYKTSFQLERMVSFASVFGDPHKSLKAILIGGTKGKGSVASFINSILIESGYKTGLYTSPHLFCFRERIRINGEAIDEESVAKLIEEIKFRLEKEGKARPTYFEAVTLAAFLYFKRNGADFVVLEVGMGGRLDSTNISKALVSVITPISYDHQQHLGSALGDIAFEKCGIIKENAVTISSSQRKEAMDVIHRTCRRSTSRLYTVGEDIHFEIFESTPEGQALRIITPRGEYPELRIKLPGNFQAENAACAVAAAESLRENGIFIDHSSIKKGLMKAKWPCRFQIAGKKPFIVLDGAQNAASASALKKALKALLRYKRFFLVIGAMRDKDVDGICRELAGEADYAVAAKSASERACAPEIIRENILKYNSGIEVTAAFSSAAAVEECVKRAGQDDLIVVTGSLYVAAEAAAFLQGINSSAGVRGQV